MQNFSDACERNKQPILDALSHYFTDIKTVLEIGSGSGQHALHFLEAHPHLHWQASDRQPYFDGVAANISRYGNDLLPPTVYLDVNDDWAEKMPQPSYEAVYTANTLHIMSALEVERLFAGLPAVTHAQSYLFLYGPFRYQGQYTSPSNADFDQWLKARDPLSGIRDFETITELANAAGFALSHDHPMPANNQLTIWQRG